jgi:hypothetical protein
MIFSSYCEAEGCWDRPYPATNRHTSRKGVIRQEQALVPLQLIIGSIPDSFLYPEQPLEQHSGTNHAEVFELKSPDSAWPVYGHPQDSSAGPVPPPSTTHKGRIARCPSMPTDNLWGCGWERADWILACIASHTPKDTAAPPSACRPRPRMRALREVPLRKRPTVKMTCWCPLF